MRVQGTVQKDIAKIRKNNMEICIFGAGRIGSGIGKRILDLLDLNVNFYCDSNADKWGTEIVPGVFCISPQELSKQQNCACFVLMGQYYIEAAVKQVKEMGISIVIDYDELCSLDEVVEKFFNLSDEVAFDDILQEHNLSEQYNEKTEYQIPNPLHKKAAVYTCIAGNYDDVTEPEVVSEKFDYYLISDSKPNNLKVFQWIDIHKIVPDGLTDNRKRNRYCKINVNRILKNYKYSIYIDGNVKIVDDVSHYISDTYLKKSGFASHKHAYDNCLYVEAIRVIAAKVENEEIIRQQVIRYRKEGMPRDYGQLHNAVLVRENNNPLCMKLMEDWWKEVAEYSYRDQISLMYCIWKNKLTIDDIGILGPNMRKNSDFVWVSRHHV